MIKVLFVCLGNICRSPTARGVFEARVRAAGLGHAIAADSAGTGDYHLGESPDTRAVRAARARGIEIGHYRARQVTPEDFRRHHLVLAMDRANHRALAHALAHLGPGIDGDAARARLRLFLEFAPGLGESVPDPYYGGPDGFERVLDLCEAASDGLIRHLAADGYPSAGGASG